MTKKTEELLANPAFRIDAAEGNMGVEPLRRKYSGARRSVREARDIAVRDYANAVITAPIGGDEWTIPSTKPSPTPPRPTPQKFNVGGKWKRFVAGSDIHGDMQDADANRVFFDFTENIWKPEVRVCMGDVWDFRPMRGGANLEERQESMTSDYKAGMVWLERFFGVPGEKYLLRGNHDERLWEWAYTKRGVEQDFAAGKVQHVDGEIARMGVDMRPYHKRDGVLRLGHMKMLHGFFAGANAARQHAGIYDSCIFGHTHSIDQHPVAGLERRVARGIGCLAKLDMSYNARQANSLRHAHGFAYGVLNTSNGNYAVWQAESVEGVWILPSDVVEKS